MLPRSLDPLTRYLYSTPNIVGCAMGIAGLGLHAAGIATTGWLGIVAALYASGALLAPRSGRGALGIDRSADAETVKQQLALVVARAERRLPTRLAERVRSIEASIHIVLDRSSGRIAGDPMLFTVRETALEYLPTALNEFLALPPAYAKLHPIDGRRTATDVLEDQLRVLDEQMRQIASDVLEGDARRLLVHGRFLQEKFAGSRDLAPDREPGDNE